MQTNHKNQNPTFGHLVLVGFTKTNLFNRPFLSLPGPLYQNQVECSAFDMEMIFHSYAN